MNQKIKKKKSLKNTLLSVPPVVWVLLLMLVFFSITGGNFLSLDNALNLCKQGAALLILCMGVIFVKITGGMDLSNGAVLSLSGMVMGWVLANTGLPVGFALIGAILCSVLFGLLNGFMVSIMGIPSFIATLGSQGIALGLALGMNNGRIIGGVPDSLAVIGGGDLFGIPYPFIIALGVFALSYILLNHTKFGIYVYAVGGNAEALKLSGKSINLIRTLAYAYSGLTAGIAALILTSRNMAAHPTIGQGMEFEAFAGVVLGGSYLAGKGTATGAALGAIVIIILRNGLNIIGIPTFLQLAIFGSVLISAIIASTLVEQNVRKWMTI
jgi:ribose transport system permease protein